MLYVLAIVVVLIFVFPVAITYAKENAFSVPVTEETFFSFIPNTTGYWIFETSDNMNDVLRLRVYNDYGHLLATDDNSAGNLNVIIKVHLVEGADYTIHVGFLSAETIGTYTLTVSMSNEFIPPPVASHRVADVDLAYDIYYFISDDYVVVEQYTPSNTSEITSTPVITALEVIPSHGGIITVSVPERFIFSPETTGSWTMSMVGLGDFVVMDTSESFRLTAWHNNPFITIHLAAGHTYIIDAWTVDVASISISPTYQIHPAEDVITLSRIVSRPTKFSFIPNITGYWVLETSNNIGDPLLQILDASGQILFEDDDSGDGLNAFLKVYLVEGVEYTIHATFFAGGGSYRLDILGLMGIEPQRERQPLVPI